MFKNIINTNTIWLSNNIGSIVLLPKLPVRLPSIINKKFNIKIYNKTSNKNIH